MLYLLHLQKMEQHKIAESLFLNDYAKLEKAIAEYMDKAISFYDTASESFYHGLVLELIAMMESQYKIKSNRESGKGRFDICLMPRDDNHPGMIMELKWKKNLDDNELALLGLPFLEREFVLKLFRIIVLYEIILKLCDLYLIV